MLAWEGVAGADDLEETLAEATETRRGVEVGVSEAGRVTAVQLGSSVLDDCAFFPELAPSEILTHLQGQVFAVGAIDVGVPRWTMIVCPAAVFAGSRYGFWPVGDPVPRSVVVFLGREAVARAEVGLPLPRGAPDGVEVAYVTQMPTWWWLEDADWRRVTGTAALGEPAPASITAVLIPVESVWQVGDGAPVVCGQGVPWSDGRGEDVPGRCGTVVEQVSGPGGVEQTVSVVFEVSFVCVPAALCDRLPPFDPVVVSTTTTVEVIQVRGVLVS